MTRTRVLIVSLVALVSLNLATLSVILFRKPPHPDPRGHGGPRAIIIERLKFDPGQVAAYEELIRDHRHTIDSLDRVMLDLRGQLYDPQNPQPADSILARIGTTQASIERVHADHFGRIRALCRPEQIPFFDDLSKDLARYFRHGAPPAKDQR